MTNPELVSKLQKHKDQAYKWRERRHAQWTESYEMYRDTVVVNRLIQRQSVNIPLMKMTIRTLLSKFKRRTDLVFEDYGNDKQKDVFKNAYWQHCYKDARLKQKDRANKKQAMLTGRAGWKLMVAEGRFNAEVTEAWDILIDRYADPSDIDGTADDVIHMHIYRRLKDLEANPAYDKSAIAELKHFYSTPGGLKKAAENVQAAQEKAQRMSDLGVPDVLDPQVGETIVELNEHYVRLWDDAKGKFAFHLVTMADDKVLRRQPLSEAIGRTSDDYWDAHIPFVFWADDEERTDVWSDGVADIVRTINKVLNAWFSQLVENRTLRNFSMNFYDATANPDWTPQSFDPRPFGWYPLPGKPGEVYQRADIPELSESLDEMQFLITIAEQATAATATQKGTSEKSQITLGEVQMMLVEAEDRISDMEEPYQDSWVEFGEKWSKLVTAQAASLKPVSLYKKGYRGNWFDATVTPAEWLSDEGYGCVIKSAAERERDQINAVQKVLAIKAQFPMNMAFKRISDKKLLELADLNPEEVKEVETEEEQRMAQVAAMAPMLAAMQGGPTSNPKQNASADPGQVQPVV